MTYKEWFDSLDVRGDINEAYAVYRTVLDRNSSWGYDIQDIANGFIVSRNNEMPHRFTKATAAKFCEYVDSLYDPNIEGVHYALTAK